MHMRATNTLENGVISFTSVASLILLHSLSGEIWQQCSPAQNETHAIPFEATQQHISPARPSEKLCLSQWGCRQSLTLPSDHSDLYTWRCRSEATRLLWAYFPSFTPGSLKEQEQTASVHDQPQWWGQGRPVQAAQQLSIFIILGTGRMHVIYTDIYLYINMHFWNYSKDIWWLTCYEIYFQEEELLLRDTARSKWYHLSAQRETNTVTNQLSAVLHTSIHTALLFKLVKENTAILQLSQKILLYCKTALRELLCWMVTQTGLAGSPH